MDHNQTTVTVINTALLPNFLLWLAMFLVMGYLWYILEYKPYKD